MRYGISAGGIVIRDDRLLLVHHRGVEQGAFDFWVGPGGRLEGSESIFDCAQRETFEETGLRVDPLRIVYIEEFVEPDYHFCKFWILCRELGGSLTLDNENPAEHQVVEARFLAYPEMQGLRVYPEVFKDGLWEDARQGFPATRYLGLQRTS